MRNHSAALLCTACVVWCLMTAGTRNVHPADLRFDPQRLNGITDRMRGFVESKQIAGAVTLVATPDQTIHLSAVGAADVAGGRAMSPDSIFRIASMTKTITATALMLLVDEGRLSVDDPIEKYLPVFHGQKLHDGNAVSPVTIRDAVTHTAGLYRGRTSTGGTLAETVDEIGRSPLQFVPGSKWQYSSGLTVAGRIIEVVSGMPYEKFLADRIFTPLRMTDTSFVLTQAQAQRLAITYQPAKDGNLTVSTHAFTTRDPTIRVPPNPSGGLYSTARDLARFYQMILSGGTRGQLRFLSTQSLGAMTGLQTDKNIVTGFTPGNGWGLGWCVVRHPQGVSRLLNAGSYGHGGAFGTQAWIDPQRGLLCLLLIQRTNFGNADGSDVRDAFQEEALRADRGIVRSGAAFRPLWNYDKAIELTSGPARVVLSPQAGGRVLVYSSGGKNALFLDEAEKDWQPDGRVVASAGRFDIGPELMIPKRTALWAGDWSGEITGDRSARLTSPKDASTGVQLIRDFSLGENSSELACRQT
ncbi:MAG: serine hydrolase, partial [Planctomycetaceae bacterium]